MDERIDLEGLLYLDNSTPWTEVHARLRDDTPKGVYITSKAALQGFLQAWRRAGKPPVVVALAGPGLVE